MNATRSHVDVQAVEHNENVWSLFLALGWGLSFALSLSLVAGLGLVLYVLLTG